MNTFGCMVFALGATLGTHLMARSQDTPKTGRSAQPNQVDLRLGRTALKGIGDCRQTKSDFPERGLTAYQCFLDLSDPLGQYVSGQLTTNTMNSLNNLGLESDPPGYVQASIATIRLWKRRSERQAP